jgi:hypothetical protein
MKVDVIAQMTTMLGLAAWATTSPGAARNIAESNTFLYRSNDLVSGETPLAHAPRPVCHTVRTECTYVRHQPPPCPRPSGCCDRR